MFHLRRISKTIINPRQPRRAVLITSSTKRFQSASAGKSRQGHDCPNCGTPLPTTLPTCTNVGCGYIEPIPKELRSDYYAIFGFPGVRDPEPTRNPFSIDTKALRRQFLDMQKVCHPDRWAQSGKSQAEAAVDQSAQINKAYQTLLSPRLRAEYIIAQHGIDIREADTLENEQELMMEVMEAREELENAEGEQIQKLLAANDERLQNITAELEDAIGKEDWQHARRLVIQLRYWESFQRAGKGMEVDH